MIIILIGVSGSGKTTIGSRLAEDLGWRFYEGDDFHLPSSIEKMEHGIPLTDADREVWLEGLRRLIHELIEQGESAVLACSALKRRYRDHLLNGNEDEVCMVYLRGSYELIRKRLAGRKEHFMKASMLASQFEDLEEPTGIPTVDIDQDPDAIVRSIEHELGISGANREDQEIQLPGKPGR